MVIPSARRQGVQGVVCSNERWRAEAVTDGRAEAGRTAEQVDAERCQRGRQKETGEVASAVGVQQSRMKVCNLVPLRGSGDVGQGTCSGCIT